MINLPKLIGHRGVKSLYPENTIASIEKAIQLNLRWIEVDVKISKDKIPFLLHDDILDRTTSGTGSPLNYEYKDICKLDAGQWFSKDFVNLYPPKLEEILTLCFKKKVGVNIELKPNKDFEKENVIAVADLFKRIKFKPKYFFSSFDWNSAVLIKKILPESCVGILIDEFNFRNEIETILKKCDKYNFFSCGFNIDIINKNIVDLCKKYNKKITIYSSQNITKKEAQRLWKIGVDSIFIDDPSNL